MVQTYYFAGRVKQGGEYGKKSYALKRLWAQKLETYVAYNNIMCSVKRAVPTKKVWRSGAFRYMLVRVAAAQRFSYNYTPITALIGLNGKLIIKIKIINRNTS